MLLRGSLVPTLLLLGLLVAGLLVRIVHIVVPVPVE